MIVGLPHGEILSDGYSYAPNHRCVGDWTARLKAHGYRVWMVSDEGKGVYAISVCMPGYRYGYQVRSLNQVDYLLSVAPPVWE